MRRLLTLYFLLILMSCNKATKKLDFDKFEIEVPNSWHKIAKAGIDSQVGGITMDNNDTLYFDLGWYSNDLAEDKPYLVEGNSVHLINQEKSTDSSIVYDYYGTLDTIDLKKFLKNEYKYIKIDNRRAKLVFPKKSGTGTTGVFFDSLWVRGNGVDRFQLSGNNLKDHNQKELLNAINTIKFKK